MIAFSQLLSVRVAVMLSDRFVVEADRRTVGVAVRVKGGYRFFASDPLFFSLEGMVFSGAKTMSERVAEIAHGAAPADGDHAKISDRGRR